MVQPHISPEIKIATDDDIKFKVINRIKNYAEHNNYNIITIDGVKIFFEDGCALVRASNTGPNITCRFESKDENKLHDMKEKYIKLINDFKEEYK